MYRWVKINILNYYKKRIPSCFIFLKRSDKKWKDISGGLDEGTILVPIILFTFDRSWVSVFLFKKFNWKEQKSEETKKINDITVDGVHSFFFCCHDANIS